MTPYDKNGREKLSWKEIDNLRDRSRHVSDERKSFGDRALQSDWAKRQHLREAEKYFQGKKGTASYKSAYSALHEKYGTPEFQKAMADFLEEFGLPDEWGTLLLILDSHDSKWVKEALSAMKVLYPKRSPIEQRGFKGKLKVLAMTTRDKSVRQECEKKLEEL